MAVSPAAPEDSMMVKKFNKKTFLFIIAFIIVIIFFIFPIFKLYKQSIGPEFCGMMSRGEALKIAKQSQCMQEGKLTPFGYQCNEVTGTWWFNLNVTKKGCLPACVVNILTKQAEVNWRCTGLKF